MPAGAEGTVPADHVTNKRFVLKHPAVGEIPALTVSPREQRTQDFTAPDGTTRSSGTVEPVEVEIEIADGLDPIRAKMREWWIKGQTHQPGYKGDATLTIETASGQSAQVETWTGAWCPGPSRAALTKRSGDEGAALESTWIVKFDRLLITDV